MSHLHCIGADCGATFELHTPVVACPRCGELLEVVVDAPKMDVAQLKSLWSDRRRSFAPVDASGVWRFREALPQYADEHVVTLREGNVPMVRAQPIAVTELSISPARSMIGRVTRSSATAW